MVLVLPDLKPLSALMVPALLNQMIGVLVIVTEIEWSTIVDFILWELEEIAFHAS